MLAYLWLLSLASSRIFSSLSVGDTLYFKSLEEETNQSSEYTLLDRFNKSRILKYFQPHDMVSIDIDNGDIEVNAILCLCLEDSNSLVWEDDFMPWVTHQKKCSSENRSKCVLRHKGHRNRRQKKTCTNYLEYARFGNFMPLLTIDGCGPCSQCAIDTCIRDAPWNLLNCSLLGEEKLSDNSKLSDEKATNFSTSFLQYCARKSLSARADLPKFKLVLLINVSSKVVPLKFGDLRKFILSNEGEYTIPISKAVKECIEELQKANPAFFESPKERDHRNCVEFYFPLCANIMAQQFEIYKFNDNDNSGIVGASEGINGNPCYTMCEAKILEFLVKE